MNTGMYMMVYMDHVEGDGNNTNLSPIHSIIPFLNVNGTFGITSHVSPFDDVTIAGLDSGSLPATLRATNIPFGEYATLVNLKLLSRELAYCHNPPMPSSGLSLSPDGVIDGVTDIVGVISTVAVGVGVNVGVTNGEASIVADGVGVIVEPIVGDNVTVTVGVGPSVGAGSANCNSTTLCISTKIVSGDTS